MRFHPTPLLAVLATATIPSLVSAAEGGAYTLKDDLSYKNFFDNFEFFSGKDPTNGFVQYQDHQSAVANEYVGYLDDAKSVYLGVDYKNKDPKGRASVRLESKKTWNKGLLVADIRHMPENVCGSWPAFWTLGALPWPTNGEIDILEGVNDYQQNAVTLHTSEGCVVDDASKAPAKRNPRSNSRLTGLLNQADAQQQPQSPAYLGKMTTSNCDVNAAGQGTNVGCSIKAPASVKGSPGSAFPSDMELPSYGASFNAAGGGVYAMEWTSDYIAVWFIPRTAPTFSSLFGDPAAAPDPSAWGTPIAKFSGKGCDFEKKFRDLKVIFNVTFCGDWAGGEWTKGCAARTNSQTCEAYVRDNPQAFEQAYWEIQGLRWYERGGGSWRWRAAGTGAER
ncbi:hypothetical protein BS50DRAFT_603323 [Corynespora cassiicola Philippines]|uniref:endo-1,3(4)-beta-glucanase n=1 Tax=Corynespora cassiicola Philippines TaxID=1448308 RepID=A0A2T2NBA6_CORCC|nr:hypothetical protein BS50DRAFT_603323 [Corynespora cassiicola Philippines]